MKLAIRGEGWAQTAEIRQSEPFVNFTVSTPGDYAVTFVGNRAELARAFRTFAETLEEEQRNQCDGCQAGRPLDANGNHRMGDGAYSDLMGCQAGRYAPCEHVPVHDGGSWRCNRCSAVIAAPTPAPRCSCSHDYPHAGVHAPWCPENPASSCTCDVYDAKTNPLGWHDIHRDYCPARRGAP